MQATNVTEIDISGKNVSELVALGYRVWWATTKDLPGKTENKNGRRLYDGNKPLGRPYVHDNGTVYYTICDGYRFTAVIVEHLSTLIPRK